MEHNKMSLRTRGRRLMNSKQPVLGLATGECCTRKTHQYEGKPGIKKGYQRIYFTSTSSESDEKNVLSTHQSAYTVPCCDGALVNQVNSVQNSSTFYQCHQMHQPSLSNVMTSGTRSMVTNTILSSSHVNSFPPHPLTRVSVPVSPFFTQNTPIRDKNHNVVGIDAGESHGRILHQLSRRAAAQYCQQPAAARVMEVDRCESPVLSNSTDLTGDDDDTDDHEKALSCVEPEMNSSDIIGCVQKRSRKIHFDHAKGVTGAHPVFCRQFYSDCEIYHEHGGLPTSIAVYHGRKPSFWLDSSSAAGSSCVTQTDIIMQRKYCQTKNLRPSQLPFRTPPGVSSEEHAKKVVEQLSEWSLMLARQGVSTCRKDVVRSNSPWIPVTVKKCKIEVDENFCDLERGSPADVKPVPSAVHCLRPVRVKETNIMKSNCEVGDAAEVVVVKDEKLLEACETEARVGLPPEAVDHHSTVTDVQIVPSLSMASHLSEKTSVTSNQTCGQGAKLPGDGFPHRNQKSAGFTRAEVKVKPSDSVAKKKRSGQSKPVKTKQEGKMKGKPCNKRRKNEERVPSLRQRIIDHFPADYNDMFTDRHSDAQDQAVYEYVDEDDKSPCIQRRRPVHNRAEYLFDKVQADEDSKVKENGGRTMNTLLSDVQNDEVCSTTGELEACLVSSPYRKRTARRNLIKLPLQLAVDEHDDIDDFSDAGSSGATEANDPTYRPAMKKGRKTEGSQAAKNKATIQQLPTATTERNVANGRRSSHFAPDSESGSPAAAPCPVCLEMQPTSEMNSHLDLCLNLHNSMK